MGFFDSNNDTDRIMNDMFANILYPKFAEAKRKYMEATNKFYDSDDSIIHCTCPSCNKDLKLKVYNKDSGSLINDGIVTCNSCNSYIEFKLVGSNNPHILLRKYDHCEKIDLIDKMIKYLINNVSIDDWKIIFSNIDLSAQESVYFKMIKETLEKDGVVFEEENNNEKENK